MTGQELKKWAKETGLRAEQIAVDLDMSAAGVFKWYRAEKLSRVVELALLQKYADRDPKLADRLTAE